MQAARSACMTTAMPSRASPLPQRCGAGHKKSRHMAGIFV
jgi:hypothetical protein